MMRRKTCLGIFAICLVTYLVCFFFFSSNFDKREKNEVLYSIYYINLLDKSDNDADKIIKNLLKKDESQIYIIESNNKIKIDTPDSFFNYQKKLSSSLLILSKFKLGKNKTDFFEHFLTPAFTGIIHFPLKKVLFSFFSFEQLPVTNESEYFKRMLITKRVETCFWRRKKSGLIIAKWGTGSLRSKIRKLKRTNKRYRIFSLSKTPCVFKTNNLKVFDIKQEQFGFKIYVGNK